MNVSLRFPRATRALLVCALPAAALAAPAAAHASVTHSAYCAYAPGTETAPANATSVQITLHGAAGAGSVGDVGGGDGASETISMPVSGGQQFSYSVGCQGQANTGGYGGGGDGFAGANPNPNANGDVAYGGGGGGATFVAPFGSSLSGAYAVAGGGGGGGGAADTGDPSVFGGIQQVNGGNADASGQDGLGNSGDNLTGGGGGQSGEAGGTAGAGADDTSTTPGAAGTAGTAGATGVGGAGGAGGMSSDTQPNVWSEGGAGGGGGGGWVGGGGGGGGYASTVNSTGEPDSTGGGGGGGQSYIAGSVTTTSAPTADVTGNGSITFTYHIGQTLSTDTQSLDYGSAVDGTSQSQTVTVTNTGDDSLSLGHASIDGANPDQYAITADNCSDETVSAGSDCTVTVAFAPSASGAQTGTLELPSDSLSGSPTSIALSGTGFAPATATPNRSSNDFGKVAVGQSSSSATFTVTNTSNAVPLYVGLAKLSGQNADQFTITSDTCSNSMVYGGTCTIGVQFKPTAVGAQTAELSVPSTAPDSPTVIKLSGTGEAISQPSQPTPPTTSQPPPPTTTQPTPPTKPQPTSKLVVRVTHAATNAQRLLAHGETTRVFCSRACSLKVSLDVYYRALVRGSKYGKRLAHTTRMQPWTQVTVGQATVKLTRAGDKTYVVKVSPKHHKALADAGSILLGVYAHDGQTLVSKHWMQVKGPNMNAMVRALNSGR